MNKETKILYLKERIKRLENRNYDNYALVKKLWRQVRLLEKESI